jgi:hypothetical protein
MGLVIEARFVEVRKVVSKTAEEVTVENTWEDFVVVADGSEQEVPSSSTTTKYSLTGALISMSGDMVTSDAYRASMVDHFSYPEAAVAVGDEWVKEHAGDSTKGSTPSIGCGRAVTTETRKPRASISRAQRCR